MYMYCTCTRAEFTCRVYARLHACILKLYRVRAGRLKSSEDFLHGCLGACMYVVYLVLLGSPSRNSSIAIQSTRKPASNSWGSFDCGFCTVVGDSLFAINWMTTSEMLYALCFVACVAILALLLDPRMVLDKRAFWRHRHACLDRPAVCKQGYQRLLFAIANISLLMARQLCMRVRD